MTVTALRPTDDAPSLDALAADPGRVTELALPECTALVMRLTPLLVALGARLVETAKPAPGLEPPLDVKTAAPLLGLSADLLARKARTDEAFKALRFDNGTDRLLFDPGKVAAFRRRRTG
jgi:hypothetical protein